MSEDVEAIFFSVLFFSLGIAVFIGAPFLFILAGNHIGLLEAEYALSDWLASLAVLLMLGGAGSYDG